MLNIVDRYVKKQSAGGHPHPAQAENAHHRIATQNAISRRYCTLLIAFVFLLAAAACAPAGGEAAVVPDSQVEPTVEPVAEPTEEAQAEEPAEATGEPRTITDAMGREVTFPAAPQRVVVLSEIDLDSLLALGIVPVGAPNGRGQTTLPSYMLPLIEGKTTAIGPLGEPNLETIVALDPDLIVYSDPYGDLAERIPELEQIAPVVVPYVDTGVLALEVRFPGGGRCDGQGGRSRSVAASL